MLMRPKLTENHVRIIPITKSVFIDLKDIIQLNYCEMFVSASR